MRWLRRRHRYNAKLIDAIGWRHPRPSSDPRLVCLHIALPWVALVQIVTAPGPSSVQAQAFSSEATLVFSALMIMSSVLVLSAAFCKSQFAAFGVEFAGFVGFTGVFGIYTYAMITVIDGWYSTTGAAWSLAFLFGNAIRAAILAWRLW